MFAKECIPNWLSDLELKIAALTVTFFSNFMELKIAALKVTFLIIVIYILLSFTCVDDLYPPPVFFYYILYQGDPRHLA